MRLVVLRVLEEDLVHVGGRVLVQLVRRAEDDESDFTVAQDAEFVGLLHHAELALVERHLPVALVGYARYLNLFSTHLVATSNTASGSTSTDPKDPSFPGLKERKKQCHLL